jgi:hypothetical protein
MTHQTIEIRQLTIDEFMSLVKEAVKEELSNHEHTENNEKLWSRQKTADELGVTLVSLNTYTKKGILQSYKISGKILYRKDEVLTALEKVKNLKYKREA